MRVIWRRLMMLALWAGLLGVAHAQTGAGGMSGRILDPNGAPVLSVKASVMLRGADGKTFSGAIDEATGAFNITGVPAGTYDVDVPIPCCMYSRFEQKAVTIAAGATLRNDISVGWGMNLGTIGDDPGVLGADMRAKTKNPNAPAPRTADGKPDLSGLWVNVSTATPRPRIPMKPWAVEIQQQLQKINAEQNPGAFCLPQAATISVVNFPYKFIQTPGLLVQIAEFVTPAHRQIYLDGRPHPDPDSWNPAWYGHSVGRWEGDTLVIESVGFNEITPGFGVHSEKLKITERIRRPTYGKLEIEIIAEDPEAWEGPYRFTIESGLAEGDDVMEYVCAENNKDPQHFGGLGWRGRP